MDDSLRTSDDRDPRDLRPMDRSERPRLRLVGTDADEPGAREVAEEGSRFISDLARRFGLCPRKDQGIPPAA